MNLFILIISLLYLRINSKKMIMTPRDVIKEYPYFNGERSSGLLDPNDCYIYYIN